MNSMDILTRDQLARLDMHLLTEDGSGALYPATAGEDADVDYAYSDVHGAAEALRDALKGTS